MRLIPHATPQKRDETSEQVKLYWCDIIHHSLWIFGARPAFISMRYSCVGFLCLLRLR